MTLLRKRFMMVVPLFSLLLTAGVFASNETSDNETFLEGNQPQSKPKVDIKGYSFWQFGQIIKGNDREKGSIKNAWQNGALIGLTFSAQPNNHLGLVISPEFYLNYPYPQDSREPASARPLGSTYINEAYGKFSFGHAENPFLQAKLGMFVYKYNSDGRNFGDFLFRTGTYPTWITTSFDFPAARLLGLQLSSDPVNIQNILDLHADILFTSEAFVFPFGDFSLTGIVTSKLFNAIELGAGIDFARFLSVTDSLTSPKWDVGNSNTNTPNVYLSPTGDTNYYSFKATKFMAKASIDPKKFFGSPKWLGPEDMKIYGEICWVGVGGYNENPEEIFDTTHLQPYRPWYKNLNERTPRMFGFNFPAFKLLDVLSCEFEYFPSVYPNDYRSNVFSRSPLPYFKQGLTEYKEQDWNKGAWRWSFYARKMIINGFAVCGEIAFDHLRTTYVDGSTREYECLTEKGHWHWNAKFSYNF
jgi:hypothetical protein